jgi:uncharacterized protein (TIGR03790 family)
MGLLKVTKIMVGWAILECVLVMNLHGAEPADETIVVYNKRLSESKSLAEFYAEKRQVPASQVFGFDISTNEEVSRVEFRDSLQRPLAKLLEDKKLWHMSPGSISASSPPDPTNRRVDHSKIRYAVLCYGIPLHISRDANLKEPAAEKLRPEMQRNEAAVDSELALLPVVDEKLPLAGPLRNIVFAATNSATINPTNGVLMVARLDGPTVGIARGLVDKALEAEENGLWGRAYFDIRNTTDPNFKMGDDWIRASADLCRHLGFETVMDENASTFPSGFPMSQIAIYMGWYNESVVGPFAEPTVEFMPGAFAYHLHSFSAATLRSTTRNWVGPLLAKGATITMGNVDEPYLAGTPDLTVFTARFIYQGFTFGEAAYASQSVLSWQTTVVGDPLYRPFGKHPEQLHQELIRSNSPYAAWSYLRLIDLNIANGSPLDNWITFLENLEMTKTNAVLNEKLGDLCDAQGKPSSAIHAYKESLKDQPTPKQRLSLLLKLGDKLAAANEIDDAAAQYRQIIQSYPDYPDKGTIEFKYMSLSARSTNAHPVATPQSPIPSSNEPAANGKHK